MPFVEICLCLDLSVSSSLSLSGFSSVQENITAVNIGVSWFTSNNRGSTSN